MPQPSPVLNNPYSEPALHYWTSPEGELDYEKIQKERRPFFPDVRSIPLELGNQGEMLSVQETSDEWKRHVINLIRREVTAWRDAKYPQTTRITRELLGFWFLNEERDPTQSLFFAQREAVETAIWLNEVLGFAFESGLLDLRKDFGNFQVSLVRMHDDLMQQGLLKKDKKAASFVTIGEPDIRLHTKKDTATVEIAGLDIYDPIKDEVKSRDIHDIAYWMLDDDYDGSNFVVRQIFFCGGDKDEFDDWKKGLSKLAEEKARKKAEQTLKIEIDAEAFSRLYGHTSHPFPVKKGQKMAVRVVSQFGEETTKVLEV